MDKRVLEDLISVTTKSSDKNTIFKVGKCIVWVICVLHASTLYAAVFFFGS